MKIVPYDKKYKNDFIEMNRLWISEMFSLEDADLKTLNHVDQLVEQGAEIFFAIDEDGSVLACCMIEPLANGEWEIAKFCARGMHTGRGAGSACLKACIDFAKEKRIEKIVIVSNRKCEKAVRLYRKFGFTEVPVDREKFPYDRADIAFEMNL